MTGQRSSADVGSRITKRILPIFALTILLSLTLSRGLEAENWPQWRGPTANGVAAGDKYPTEWSPTKNLAWKAKLPGIGASTPIIWDSSLFVSGGKNGENYALCLDRATGKPRWEVALGKERAGRNRKASGSNSSPVTDGEYVYFYFKSGDLACLNFDGKVIWQKNLQKEYGEDTLWWDLGTSPVLTEKLVVVACMQTGNSYVAGFEKATGKTTWKVDRELGAPLESAQSYTTPVVVRDGTSEIIVVLGADHVTAHRAETGKRIWLVGNLNPDGQRMFRSISSPVVGEGIVVAPYARGGSLTGIKLGGSGDVTQSHVAWSIGRPSADVPTPVIHQGIVYVCTDRGEVAKLDLKSGKVLNTITMPGRRGTFTASPVLAGGHLYVTNEGGTTHVVKLGEKMEVVASNELNEFIVATPVFCDGHAFVRTDDYVYCFK